jgi:L-ascorbate metabolism protein UlaG (beta-lactamase superfamily)
VEQPTRLTYVGHATVVIEMGGTRLVTDPVLRPRVAHLRRREAADAASLDHLDGVLISHAHMDHLDPASLRLLGDVPVVVPRGAGRFLSGRAGVIEADEGDELPIGGLVVSATHADHRGRRYPAGPSSPSLGYRIHGPRAVYFAGDTGLFDGMAEIGRAGVDVALLPVAGWGSRLPAGHLDPLAAAQALAMLTPRIAIPIHWGTLAPVTSGRDAPGHSGAPAREFAGHAARLAPEVEVVIVPPGGSVELP